MFNWFRKLGKEVRAATTLYDPKYTLVAFAPAAHGETTLVVEVDGVELKFVGSGTVWYRLPEFQRCPTWQETKLASFWHQLRHEKKI